MLFDPGQVVKELLLCVQLVAFFAPGVGLIARVVRVVTALADDSLLVIDVALHHGLDILADFLRHAVQLRLNEFGVEEHHVDDVADTVALIAHFVEDDALHLCEQL